MKSFCILFAIIATVSANAVGRSGWGQSGSPLSSINLGLGAAASALGQGGATANQQIVEVVSGAHGSPAILASSSGILAGVEQGIGIQQVGVANAATGTSSSINEAESQQAAAGLESLDGYLSGANLAVAQNSAATDSQGSGEIGAVTLTGNNVGWGNMGWGNLGAAKP